MHTNRVAQSMADPAKMSAYRVLVSRAPAIGRTPLKDIMRMALAQENHYVRALYDTAICEILIAFFRQRGNVPENDIQVYVEKHAQRMAVVRQWLSEQDMESCAA